MHTTATISSLWLTSLLAIISNQSFEAFAFPMRKTTSIRNFQRTNTWVLHSEQNNESTSTSTPRVINLSNRAKEQALTNDVAGDDDKLASSISVEDLSTSSTSMKTPGVKASVNTVNQRLIEEIQRSQENQVAPKTAAGKKSKEIFSEFRSKASDEERERRIEEARNLNGVNPLIALGGSVVALGGSAFLWYCTRYLAALFASHPITTDIYSLQRLFAVFRNGVMGLISLASGFFGVTGVGLFLLGARVAYGVAIGELDPTPIKRSDPLTGLPETKSKIPNIWDFMVGKKSKDGSNPFL